MADYKFGPNINYRRYYQQSEKYKLNTSSSFYVGYEISNFRYYSMLSNAILVICYFNYYFLIDSHNYFYNAIIFFHDIGTLFSIKKNIIDFSFFVIIQKH